HYTARTWADVTSAAEVSGRNRVGYDCFPLADARLDLLEKSPRTAKDLECPHGGQFYDAVIDGKQRPRNGWIYERPRPEMKAVADRFGFWEDVKVGRSSLLAALHESGVGAKRPIGNVRFGAALAQRTSEVP